MLRRLLIVVLTLAVPVQGLAVPHSHGMVGGGELDPHTRTPHIHIGHQHHHDHQHTGEHQHQHPHPEAAASSHAHHDSGTLSEHPEHFGHPRDSRSHDDGAIFVSGDSGFHPTKVTRQVIGVADLVFWAAPEPLNKLVPGTARSFAGRSPIFSGVPLFLAALSLRL